MPTPAQRLLTGISHGIVQRSVSAPNRGWTTEESRVAARTMPEAAG